MLKGLLKFVASIFILFHLLTMLVMPNPGSYVAEKTLSVLTPYAAAVGLNASFNFFSPDPAHVLYIRYDLYKDNDWVETHFFPKEKNQAIFDLTRRRDLYVMRFMMMDVRRLQILLGPWLCKKYPDIEEIRMEMVVESIAPLRQAQVQQEDSMQDLSRSVPWRVYLHNCKALENSNSSESITTDQVGL